MALGLTFQTIDFITRISATDAAAAQAGAAVGDALYQIGQANVWGICAKEAGQFFVGPAGCDGGRALLRLTLPSAAVTAHSPAFSVQITVIRGCFTVDSASGCIVARADQFVQLTLARDTPVPQRVRDE